MQHYLHSRLDKLNAGLEMHRREHPEAKDATKNAEQLAHESSEHGNYRVVNATAAQRADAFIDTIITPALESGAFPTCGGAPANVCVTVPMERLQNPDVGAEREALKSRLADGTLRHYSATVRAPNGPGEMLISATTAQRLACDATIQRAFSDRSDGPQDVVGVGSGSSQRNVKGSEWRGADPSPHSGLASTTPHSALGSRRVNESR